jgi:hypothetical protein
MMDPIQILTEIRVTLAQCRCETFEDVGKAVAWHVLYNAGQHLEGKFPVINHSQIGILQGFATNQHYPSSIELEDVA